MLFGVMVVVAGLLRKAGAAAAAGWVAGWAGAMVGGRGRLGNEAVGPSGRVVGGVLAEGGGGGGGGGGPDLGPDTTEQGAAGPSGPRVRQPLAAGMVFQVTLPQVQQQSQGRNSDVLEPSTTADDSYVHG